MLFNSKSFDNQKVNPTFTMRLAFFIKQTTKLMRLYNTQVAGLNFNDDIDVEIKA